jgi:predicted nucleic acid-binding protein
MTANVFVDTNVFLYAVDQANLQKQHAAQAWRTYLWESSRGRISFQVLQEFYVNAIRKQPSARIEIRKEVTDLMAWQPIVLDSAVIVRGWKIEDRYGISFWDSLIVAAAKVASCRYLLTEDLQQGQELDQIIVVNPFLSEPLSLR